MNGDRAAEPGLLVIEVLDRSDQWQFSKLKLFSTPPGVTLKCSIELRVMVEPSLAVPWRLNVKVPEALFELPLNPPHIVKWPV